jgi:hypothetical protein
MVPSGLFYLEGEKMIKKVQRASISPDFKTAVCDLAKERLQKLHTDYLRLNPAQQKNFMRTIGLQIATLQNLLSDTGKQDIEWARFRMLPYEAFDVEQYKGVAYLKGITRSIQIPEDRSDLGPYAVYVSMKDYVAGDTSDIHFVPQRDPLNGYRFWHHYALGPRTPWSESHYGFGVEDKHLRLTHPLESQPFTCWGDFGSVATMQFGEMNTPELYRTFSVYLSRHNPGSNLVPMEMRDRVGPLRLSFASSL